MCPFSMRPIKEPCPKGLGRERGGEPQPSQNSLASHLRVGGHLGPRLLQAFFGSLISWPGPSLRRDDNYLGFFLGGPPSLVIERVLDKSATPLLEIFPSSFLKSRAVVIPKVHFFKVQSSSGLFFCDSTQRVMFCPEGVHPKPAPWEIFPTASWPKLPRPPPLEPPARVPVSTWAVPGSQHPLWVPPLEMVCGCSVLCLWLWTDSDSPCDLW